MKTKSSHLFVPAILVAVSLVALAQTAPPKDNTPSSAEEAAKRKVAVEIYHKISPREISFSRAEPMPRHLLQFQPQLLVDGEARLPFAIAPRADKEKPMLQGYVRLSDQAIFLLDPKTGKHTPSSQDPRFAPPGQQRPLQLLPEVAPVKPA